MKEDAMDSLAASLRFGNRIYTALLLAKVVNRTLRSGATLGPEGEKALAAYREAHPEEPIPHD